MKPSLEEWTKPGPASRTSWLWMALWCALTVLVVESRLLLTPGMLLTPNTDATVAFYPLRALVHGWVKQGVVPLWDPYIFNGLPLQTGLRSVLNPTLLLTLLSGSLEQELRWTVFVHLFLAHFGALLWLRSWRFSLLAAWFGSAAATLSGFQLSHLFAGHYDILTCLAWAPWLLWSTRLALTRSGPGWSGLAVACWSLLMSGGHYHGIYLSCWYLGAEFTLAVVSGVWGGVPAWSFAHFWERGEAPPQEGRGVALGRGYLRLIAIGLTVLGLNCWQFLPSLYTVAHSVRGEAAYVNAIEFGAPPWAWLSLWIPHLYQGEGFLPWCRWKVWEGQGFLGVGALLLLAAALLHGPRRRWLAHLGVLMVAHWLALGDHGGLFSLYYKLDPAVRMFRAPSRFLWPATLAGAWLVACGAQTLIERGFVPSRGYRRCLLGLIGMQLVFWAVTGLGGNGSAGWWQNFLGATALSNAPDALELYRLSWSHCGFSLLVTLLFGVSLWGVPRAGRPWLLVLGTLWELSLFARGYQQIVTGSEVTPPPEVVTFLRERAEADRICSDPGLGWLNHFVAASLSEVTGYENNMGRDYARQILLASHQPADAFVTAYFNPLPGGLQRLQSTRFYVQAVDFLQQPDHPAAPAFGGLGQLAIPGTPYFLYYDPQALPRAYFTPGACLLKRPGRGVLELQRDWERTRRNARLELVELRRLQAYARQLGFTMEEAGAQGQAPAVLEPPLIRPNEVWIQCANSAPGVLILTDAPWPGWRARCDGREVPLFRSEADLHRAVFLPPGRHSVQFYFQPEGLAEGGAMAAGTALAVACWIMLAGAAGSGRIRFSRR